MTTTLRSLRKICGFWLRDADRELGKPKDWLFDSSHWTARYLRVTTGMWPARRNVLVAPFAFGEIDELVSVVYLNVTLKSLVDRPRLGDHRTSVRLRRAEVCSQTRWIGNDAARTTGREVVASQQSIGVGVATTQDPQLCSWREVLGYTVQTLDARIGHVSDLIAEDHNWTIRFLVVDIGGWWGGKKLLVLPEWIKGVSCRDSLVRVNVGADVVCDAPRFRSTFLFNYEYQEELLSIYYGNGAGR